MKSLTSDNVFYSVSSVMTTNTEPKLIASAFFAIYSFLFDPVVSGLYIAIAVLITFDFLTALIATLRSREKITSAKASRTLVKLVVYGILVSASTLVDKFILEQGKVFGDLTMGFIAITEFISIIENIGRAGFAIPKGVLKSLRLIRSRYDESTIPPKQD